MPITDRPRRTDASRNTQRLLMAADVAFTEAGVDASLERIARNAGVAIGTLYAHFPTRRALIATLLRECHDQLFASGEKLLQKADPKQALREWVGLAAAHCATYRGLVDLITKDSRDASSELGEDCRRMNQITKKAVDKVDLSGVKTADLMALIAAAAWLHENKSPQQSRALLRHCFKGLGLM